MDKVCDICGDTGFAEAIMTCCICKKASEHIYCMQPQLGAVEGLWHCDECLASCHEDAKLKKTFTHQKIMQNGCSDAEDANTLQGKRLQLVETRNSKIKYDKHQSSRKEKQFFQGTFKTTEMAKVKFISDKEAALLATESKSRACNTKEILQPSLLSNTKEKAYDLQRNLPAVVKPGTKMVTDNRCQNWHASLHQAAEGNITPPSTSNCTTPRMSRIAGSDNLKTVAAQTNKGAVDARVDVSSSMCVMPRKHAMDEKKRKMKKNKSSGDGAFEAFYTKDTREGTTDETNCKSEALSSFTKDEKMRNGGLGTSAGSDAQVNRHCYQDADQPPMLLTSPDMKFSNGPVPDICWKFIMPRRKRYADVQFQFSQIETGTFSVQQYEATPSACQAKVGASISAHQVDASPSSSVQHDPPALYSDDEVHVDNIQIQDGSGRVRQRREPTLARDVWQLNEGERIIIECNQLGQPIKKSASLFASFLGTVARRSQLCPLNYAKWNDMLPAYKVELLRVVQNKFVLPPDSNDFVLKSLNRKWKEYKAKLKGDYKRKGMTEEEVARICPPDIDSYQWRELVHYWFSERAQTYSAIGRAARASQSVPHTSGSKSFARLRHEFVEEHGRELGEVEFYRMTHTHRDGSFVRDESREIFERATSLIAERVGESTASTQSSYIEAEVFTELMGPERYGRVRGYGVGVTPTQLSAINKFTQDTRDSAGDVRVHRLEAEMAAMRETRDVERAEIVAMRETRDADRAEIAALRTQLQQLTSVLHMYMPSQALDISDSRREDDGHPPAS